jgi:hypothetical protein
MSRAAVEVIDSAPVIAQMNFCGGTDIEAFSDVRRDLDDLVELLSHMGSVLNDATRRSSHERRILQGRMARLRAATRQVENVRARRQKKSKT